MKSFSLALLVPLAAGAAIEGVVQRQSSWTVGQTVQTSSGPVSGHAAQNASASTVSEYLGIPFGKAPIGDLRFAAPVKFEGTAPVNGSIFVCILFSRISIRIDHDENEKLTLVTLIGIFLPCSNILRQPPISSGTRRSKCHRGWPCDLLHPLQFSRSL